MPSTFLFSQSGGIALVSGNPYSGGIGDMDSNAKGGVGGVQLLLEETAPAAIYIGLGLLSGSDGVTVGSGGILTSGGLFDGMKLTAGKDYFVPRSRLLSGLASIRLGVPAGASGGRLFWELL